MSKLVFFSFGYQDNHRRSNSIKSTKPTICLALIYLSNIIEWWGLRYLLRIQSLLIGAQSRLAVSSIVCMNTSTQGWQDRRKSVDEHSNPHAWKNTIARKWSNHNKHLNGNVLVVINLVYHLRKLIKGRFDSGFQFLSLLHWLLFQNVIASFGIYTIFQVSALLTRTTPDAGQCLIQIYWM